VKAENTSSDTELADFAAQNDTGNTCSDREQMNTKQTNDRAEDIRQYEQLEEEIRQLNVRLTEAQDTVLRSRAEFENVKKRLFREKEQSIKFANESLLLSLLPFLDDLDRALQAHAEDDAGLYKGVELIKKKFLDTLYSQWHVKEILTVGKKFDPTLHEAIAVEESQDVTETIVIEEYQRGYIYYDRVLRTAKVKVRRLVPGVHTQALTEENNKHQPSGGKHE